MFPLTGHRTLRACIPCVTIGGGIARNSGCPRTFAHVLGTIPPWRFAYRRMYTDRPRRHISSSPSILFCSVLRLKGISTILLDSLGVTVPTCLSDGSAIDDQPGGKNRCKQTACYSVPVVPSIRGRVSDHSRTEGLGHCCCFSFRCCCFCRCYCFLVRGDGERAFGACRRNGNCRGQDGGKRQASSPLAGRCKSKLPAWSPMAPLSAKSFALVKFKEQLPQPFSDTNFRCYSAGRRTSTNLVESPRRR